MTDEPDSSAVFASLWAPVDVWRAVEGDRSDLIALLRSDAPLNRWIRDELADWLEGKLQPIPLPKGRPPKERPSNLNRAICLGFDPTNNVGFAAFRYELARRFIRKKGWHLKQAGNLYFPPDRLRRAVAKRFKVSEGSLMEALRRARAKPPSPDSRDWITRERTRIAYEIRRRKMGD